LKLTGIPPSSLAVRRQAATRCQPMRRRLRSWLTAIVLTTWLAPLHGDDAKKIQVRHRDDAIEIETDMLQARIQKRGYVSGIAAGSFLDKKTRAHDLGFGLHIMDFLLAPGWRDDGYSRDAKLHGNLPKHYVEGPQICTQAKKLDPEVIEGAGFV